MAEGGIPLRYQPERSTDFVDRRDSEGRRLQHHPLSLGAAVLMRKRLLERSHGAEIRSL
jgi:hypothetical protein